MTDIRLIALTITNFKGIKEYVLNIKGNNANVYGDNATYKTTLYDAFLWLLSGKDSQDRADFQIKPQDEDGNERHYLESEVEGILTINGQEMKLKRMLSEKWVKKKGSEKKEYEGNETNYWIDDVPVKAGEYKIKISSIIKENIFKLLTNPLFFNSDSKGAEWQDRRKILFEISGDVSDETVIQSNEKLFKLTGILAGKTIEDYKKILTERIKKLNGEIEKIPTRIDEASKSLPEQVIDYTSIELQLQLCKEELAVIEAEQTSASEQVNLYRQKHQQAILLERKISDQKAIIEAKAGEATKRITDEKAALDKEKYRLEVQIKGLNDRRSLIEQSIPTMDTEIVEMRQKWKDEFAKTFVMPDEHSFSCPTCKRPLPEGEQEQKIAGMKANFDKNKKSVCEGIQARGKTLAASKTDVEENIYKIDDQIIIAEAKLREITSRIVEIDKELSTVVEVTIDYSTDAEYRRLKEEHALLLAELDKPVEDSNAELLQQKRQITNQIEVLNKTLNNKELTWATKARIENLKLEEKRLAQQIVELEGHRYLMDEFVKAKVNLLEGNINNKFKTIRFRLFEILQEGQVKEVCRTLINTNGSWAEWNSANNAGRINAGLDIIQTLSEHYGVSAPIFIDNQESITRPFEVDAQTIGLVVSFDDKKLRVEVA